MDRTENHLIERFPAGLQKQFLKCCERFELTPAQVLVSHGEVLKHAYFPSSGAIALKIDEPGRPSIEVGDVGREGMLGSELLLGDLQSPWRAIVQVGGSCWRIEAHELRQTMAAMPPLHALLQNNFIVQVHQRQAIAWPKSRYLLRETQTASMRLLGQHGWQSLQGEQTAAGGRS